MKVLNFLLKYTTIIIIVLLVLKPETTLSQCGTCTPDTCPANEADLADGGTFCGTCSIEVGGSITISGDVCWVSGTLTIDDGAFGSNGDIIISGTGSLTVEAGTVQSNDNDGSLTVNSGGEITINNDASMEIADEITINDGATVSVNDTGNLEIDGTGIFDIIYVHGTLNVGNGTDFATLSGPSDILVDGTNAHLHIMSGGDVDSGDNIQVFNEGTMEIDAGGSAYAPDDIYNDDDFFNANNGDTGFIIVNGMIEAGADLTILTTTPPSELSGDGTLTVGGTFVKEDCTGDPSGDFCNCEGDDLDACTNQNTVPVELVFFKGEHEENQNVLTWVTATEVDNEGFYIEKSYDGKTFETVDFVEGHGTTNTPQSYSYIDHAFQDAFYRLLQIDYDGDFEYSPIIYVSESGASGIDTFLFPNPSSGEVHFYGKITDIVDLRLIDMSGREHFHSRDMTLLESEKRLNQVLPTVGNGTYMIQIKNAVTTTALRLVLNK